MKEAAPQRLWKDEAQRRINRSDVVARRRGAAHAPAAPGCPRGGRDGPRGTAAGSDSPDHRLPPARRRDTSPERRAVVSMGARQAGGHPRRAASKCHLRTNYPIPRLVLELLNKQLDRYQNVIGRLANNQVQVKTWCVTALAALAALAINNEQRGPLVIALVVVVAFFLDAYYLSLERHFRRESRRVAEEVLASGGSQRADLFRLEGPGRGQRQGWRAVRSCGEVTRPFTVLPWARSRVGPRIPPLIAS